MEDSSGSAVFARGEFRCNHRSGQRRPIWLLACPLLLASPFAMASACRIGAPTQVYVDGVLSSQSGASITVPVGTTSIQISADVQDVTPGSCTTHSLRDSILSDTTGGAYTFFDGSNYLSSISYSGFPGPFSNQINISLRNFSPGQVVAEVRCLDCTGVPPLQTYTITVVPPPVSTIEGLTPATSAVADAIDELCPNLPSNSTDPNVIDLRARCLELIASADSDGDGVSSALGELFSDVVVVQSEVQQVSTQAQFDNIKTRTESLRAGSRGVDLGGLSMNFGVGQLPLGSLFLGLLQADEGKTPEVGSDFSRWGFFASGNIGRGKADAGGASSGYDFDIQGLTMGVDYRKSDKLVLGAALGYNQQGNELALRQGSLDTKGWSITGYGTYYRNDSWYTDFSVSLGRNQFEMQRRISYTVITPTGTSSVNQVARANSNGSSVSAAASIGRDYSKNGWGFSPYLRTIYSSNRYDAMTETLITGQPGAGLALVINSHDSSSLSSVLGARLTRSHSTNWGVLVPHFEVEWQMEHLTKPSDLEAYFLFDPSRTPFTINGESIDKSFVRVGAGLSFLATKGRSGFIYYEKILAKQRIRQDGIALGLRFEF